MFKKILVATDASEYSRKALISALEIAAHFGSEIELLHVVHVNPTYVHSDIFSDIIPEKEIAEIAFEKIDTWQATPQQETRIKEIANSILEKTLADIDVSKAVLKKKIIVAYHPVVGIISECKKGFDLLIMGTRGLGMIKGVMLGSVTQRVLAEAPCPVLVVK